MDMDVLRKKISTYRGEGGRLKITDDHLYMEILSAWEHWTGSSKEFFRAIGVSKTGLASIIGKAKRMRREGHFPTEEFKELKVADPVVITPGSCAIELIWDGSKVIRFAGVDLLLDFLKKSA
jgi:hypothetical protein